MTYSDARHSEHFTVDTSGVLLEALYVVECIAPRGLQAGRFLPPTLLRLVVDQNHLERGLATLRRTLGVLDG